MCSDVSMGTSAMLALLLLLKNHSIDSLVCSSAGDTQSLHFILLTKFDCFDKFDNLMILKYFEISFIL